MNTINELETKSIGTLLARYSIPAVIGMLVSGLYNVVDRIFIGNIEGVGALAITGVGVTIPVTTLFFAFFILVALGAATNVSLKLGQRKIDTARRYIGNALVLSLIMGAILTTVGLLSSTPLLHTFGASSDTISYAKDYLDIILIGTVFAILSLVLNTMIRVDGNPKLATIIISLGCLINVLLDAIFIFKLNFGIKGAAWATVISQIITTILGLYYFFAKKSHLILERIDFKLKKKVIFKIFSLGLAPFLINISMACAQVVCNKSLYYYGGDLAIGAMTTFTSISIVFFMPIFGLNQGLQPIVGYNYGAKLFLRAKKAFFIALFYGVGIMTLGFLFIQFFPNLVIELFTQDKELIRLAVEGIKTASLSLPFLSIAIIGSNYILSIGRGNTASFLSILRPMLILIPCVIIFPRFLGLYGIFAAIPSSDFLSTLIVSIVLCREFRKYRSL